MPNDGFVKPSTEHQKPSISMGMDDTGTMPVRFGSAPPHSLGLGHWLTGQYDYRQISELTSVSMGAITKIWNRMVSKDPEVRDAVDLMKKINKSVGGPVPFPESSEH